DAPERAQRFAESNVKNQLVINAEGPEVRVGVVEDGQLAEFFVERKRDRDMVGNIYHNKITHILPNIQTTFIDLGPKVERATFLYVADVLGSGDKHKLFKDTKIDNNESNSASRA